MSEFIVDVTTDTFQEAVIAESHQRPVLVDFWAPWCGPCKTLGPILEQAVGDRAGAVLLAKVNTDHNPSLAQQFGIRGIPAVKAFVDGEVADEFMGVLERPVIDRFLDALVPSEAAQTLAKARQLLAEEKPAGVPSMLDGLVNDPEHRDDAVLLVARAYIDLGKIDQAISTLESLPEESTVKSEAEGLRVRIELARAATGVDERSCLEALERDAANHDKRWALAGLLIQRHQFPQALDHLLEILKTDRKFKGDGARRAMIAIFEELGAQNELVREYRQLMQVYL